MLAFHVSKNPQENWMKLKSLPTVITIFLLPIIFFTGVAFSAENKSVAYVYDTEDFGGYKRDLVYLPSERYGDRKKTVIPFYFAYPKDRPIKSIAVLLHGITSHKDVWWQGEGPYAARSQYKTSFLNHGIAVVALDARFHGQRANEIGYLNPKTELFFKGDLQPVYDMIVGTISDVKEVISYIQSRPEYKEAPIGILGDSMGGIIAFPAAIDDERVSYLVSLVAAPQPAPGSKLIDTVSPMTLAEKYRKPILVLSAQKDHFYSEKQMEIFFARISSQRKKHITVDDVHDFQDTRADEITDWILETVERLTTESKT